MDENYELQIDNLLKENQALREQLQKIQQMSSYFEEETKEFVGTVDPLKKNLKFKLFKKYIDGLTRPKSIFQIFQRNFYFYLVQYLELDKIQNTFNKISNSYK